MQLSCYSCNGGYYKDVEWGEWSYYDVKEIREREQINLEYLKYDVEDWQERAERQENTIQLCRDWGSRMASLFLMENNSSMIDRRHVVMLTCPSSLFRLLRTSNGDSSPLSLLENCYYNHIAFHIGLSFSLELATSLGREIPVILPHGFLNPNIRPSTKTRSAPWARSNLGHAPSQETLEELEGADEIHIIDDNIVYGGTMARMAVGVFLACEEIGNLGASINMHTWYAQTKKMRKKGGGTPIRDIQTLARNSDYVDIEKREFTDQGVFFALPGERVEPDLWSEDLLAKKTHTIQMEVERMLAEKEAKKEEEDRQRKADDDKLRVVDEKKNHLLPSKLEERLKASLEKQRKLLPIKDRITTCKIKLDEIPIIFITNYLSQSESHSLTMLHRFYDLLDRIERAPWNLEDGQWGKEIELTVQKSWGEYLNGERRVLLEPSATFDRYVGYWETNAFHYYWQTGGWHSDSSHCEKERSEILYYAEDLVSGVVRAYEENERLQTTNTDTLTQIKEGREWCIQELDVLAKSNRNGGKLTLPSDSCGNQISIGKFKSSMDIKCQTVSEVCRKVELLWDTEEKVENGKKLENKRDLLISQFQRVCAEILQISKLEDEIESLLDASRSTLIEIADFDSFWDYPRTEEDMENMLAEVNNQISTIIPAIGDLIAELMNLFESNPEFCASAEEGNLGLVEIQESPGMGDQFLLMDQLIGDFEEASLQYK